MHSRHFATSTQLPPLVADTLGMDPHRTLLSALWYGALLSALGLAEPWPPGLDKLAVRYFKAFRARARA